MTEGSERNFSPPTLLSFLVLLVAVAVRITTGNPAWGVAVLIAGLALSALALSRHQITRAGAAVLLLVVAIDGIGLAAIRRTERSNADDARATVIAVAGDFNRHRGVRHRLNRSIELRAAGLSRSRKPPARTELFALLARSTPPKPGGIELRPVGDTPLAWWGGVIPGQNNRTFQFDTTNLYILQQRTIQFNGQPITIRAFTRIPNSAGVAPVPSTSVSGCSRSSFGN